MNFASDNTAPIAPEILAALGAANNGPAPAYGSDDLTAGLRTCLQRSRASLLLRAAGHGISSQRNRPFLCEPARPGALP